MPPRDSRSWIQWGQARWAFLAGVPQGVGGPGQAWALQELDPPNSVPLGSPEVAPFSQPQAYNPSLPLLGDNFVAQ